MCGMDGIGGTTMEVKNLNKQIDTFGKKVLIIDGTSKIGTRAFIETMTYKHYYQKEKYSEYKPLYNNLYFYIGKTSIPISTATKILYNNILFDVLSSCPLEIKNRPIYIWAIITPAKEVEVK